jgi:hypothetical protein
VRKSEFAKLCNVSKGRVTQWVDEGKIDGAGLVGTGRSQTINPEIALRQLKERRAVNESCGLHGLNTKLDGGTPPTRDFRETTAARAERDPEFKAALLAEGIGHMADRPAAARSGPQPPAGEDAETVDARIKAEKLKQNEILTRKQEMEEMTRHGKWMVSADVSGEMNRIVAEMVRIFEGCFPDLASAVAAKFQISQREVLHLLRNEFKAVRTQLVAARRAAAAKSE